MTAQYILLQAADAKTSSAVVTLADSLYTVSSGVKYVRLIRDNDTAKSRVSFHWLGPFLAWSLIL